MALQSGQLTSAITASQTTFNLSNLSANAQTALPTPGLPPLSIGVPMQMDAEFMYVVSQPVIGTVVVRGRGSDGTAAVAHDILANVYFSGTAGDFPLPGASQLVTIDEASGNVVSLGQDQTVVAPNLDTIFNINKATAAALVMTAPNLSQNGVLLSFTSNTAAAHTITATSLINDGTAGAPKNLATFTAGKGATVTFWIENGLYNVQSVTGVTFS